MKWLLLSVLLLAATPVPGVPVPPPKAARRADLAKIQGRWEMVSETVRFEGGETQSFKVRGYVVVITGDRWRKFYGADLHHEARIRLDPTKTPKEIDMRDAHPADNSCFPPEKCVYKLDCDTLTVCTLNSFYQRPRDFLLRPGSWVTVLRRKTP
jgi:uncharacterized protein (TIGR03067 family)